jgi:hypothetical protein
VGTGGDLTSKVPPTLLFDTSGTGGFPGVPAYQGSTNLTAGSVSSTSWMSQNTITSPKIYDYQSFINQIPADTTINTISTSSVNNTNFNAGNSSYGYTWYKYNGAGGIPLSINGPLNIGSKKVILLVDSADLLINAPINLTKGSGFFMVLVGETAGGAKGNIVVDPAVGGGGSANIEGIYEADNVFGDSAGNTQLWVRGSVVAYSGVSLQRDLNIPNATTPAELFEFAPDQVLLFPNKLGTRRINWKEVAP